MNDITKKICIGAYLLLFLLTLIAVPLITYFSEYNDHLIRSLIYIGSAGGLGGTVYCIRGFYQNEGEGRFSFNWTSWYIFRPFISIVTGIIVYFLLVGGLLSVGSVSEANTSGSIMFYCSVSYLAGFSFTRFYDKVDELTSTLFSSKKKEENK